MQSLRRSKTHFSSSRSQDCAGFENDPPGAYFRDEQWHGRIAAWPFAGRLAQEGPTVHLLLPLPHMLDPGQLLAWCEAYAMHQKLRWPFLHWQEIRLRERLAQDKKTHLLVIPAESVPEGI